MELGKGDIWGRHCGVMLKRMWKF